MKQWKAGERNGCVKQREHRGILGKGPANSNKTRERGVDEDEKKAGRSSRAVGCRFSSQLEETDKICYFLRNADHIALHL